MDIIIKILLHPSSAFPKFVLDVLKFLLHILCYKTRCFRSCYIIKAYYVRSCVCECGLHCVGCRVHSWHMRCLVPTPSSLCSVTMTLVNTALELSTSPMSTLLRSSRPSCWSRLQRCTRLTGLIMYYNVWYTCQVHQYVSCGCLVHTWYSRMFHGCPITFGSQESCSSVIHGCVVTFR